VNAFSIFGRMSLDDRDYQSGLKRAEGETTKAAAKMETDWKKVGEAASTLGRTLSVALTGSIVGVATAAIASTTQLGRYADKILDLAEQTGLSTDRLQAFERVAIEAGVEVNVLSDAAIRLTTQLNATGDESKTLTDALDNLGISTKDADGNLRSMDDLLPDIMRGLAGVEDVTTRNALAADIFGRSSKDLIPVLALGADRINDLTDEAIRMGNVLSIDALNAANDLRIQQELLTDTISRTWREISVALIPVVSQLVGFIADRAVPAFRNFATSIVGVIEWFQTLAGWQQSVLGGLTIALAAAGPILMGIGALIVQVPKLVAAFTTLRTVMLAFSGPAGLFLLAAGGAAFLITKLVGRNSLETSVDTAVSKASELSQRLGDVNDKASLINSVKTLADYVGPEGSPGRTAFVNYANEIVATGDTAEEQFERIKLAAFEAANAVELNALRTRMGTLQSQLAFEQMATNATDQAESLRKSLEDNAAAHAETLAGMQEAADRGNREAVRMFEERLRGIESMRNELEMALAQTFEASMSIGAEASARRVERIELEIASVNHQIRTLTGAAVTMESSATSASRVVASTLTPALVATGAAASEATEELGAFVSVANDGVQVLINNAAYLRDLAQAHLEAARAASLASTEFQLMTEVSTSSADTVRDFVNVVPQVSVVLNDNATALGFVVDAYWRVAEAERVAAEEARAFANAGLEASTSAGDYAARALQLGDAASAAAVGLSASNRELALTPTQAADAATQLVAFMQVQRDLGRATDEDVNRALVNQAQALVALRSELSPLSAEWMAASNQLAGLYNGLQANEAALLGQMSRVRENTSEWTELEAQLESVRALMALLGLDTGGPPAPLAAVDNAVQQGVQALRTYLDDAGGAVGQFGSLALDVALKFPLVGAALDGFSIEVTEAGEVIVQGFNPVKALSSMFMDLLNRSESFRNLLQMVNERLAPLAERIIEPLAKALEALIDALWPVVEVFVSIMELALKPFLFIFTNVLAPLLTGIANAIRAVWNAFARWIPGMKTIPAPGKSTGGGNDQVVGRIAQLVATRADLVRQRDSAKSESDIARLNREIASVDAEIARLRGLGIEAPTVSPPVTRPPASPPAPIQPAPPSPFQPTPGAPSAPPPPPGSIAALEEERRALQAQLRVAAEGEIPELNKRIAALGEEISRLQRLGLGGPDLAKEIGKELQEVTFGRTPQSIQLAVATPLVEASNRMLDAANVMNRVFGSMIPGQELGFGALPPFTSAIERMTPVLERLLSEGVSVMMGQQSNAGPLGSPTAFLRGV